MKRSEHTTSDPTSLQRDALTPVLRDIQGGSRSTLLDGLCNATYVFMVSRIDISLHVYTIEYHSGVKSKAFGVNMDLCHKCNME